jgi:hypothetical protein
LQRYHYSPHPEIFSRQIPEEIQNSSFPSKSAGFVAIRHPENDDSENILCTVGPAQNISVRTIKRNVTYQRGKIEVAETEAKHNDEEDKPLGATIHQMLDKCNRACLLIS